MEKKQKSIKINAVLNVLKQCSTIIFPLITYPYISHVLGSDNFGRVSFSSSIIEYGVVFAMLGIPTYMVREGAKIRDNKVELQKITSEVFTISILTMLIAVFSIGILTISLPRLREEIDILAILVWNVFFSILGRDWVNTIYEDYLYVTIRYIAVKCISLVLIFLLVKRPEHFLRYVAIMLFSESGGYIANIFYSRKYVPYALTRKPNIRKHLKPLLLLFCSTLAVHIYIQSDIIILGFMRTNAEVGVYSLASRIYSVIKSVLNAIILVTIPRISYFVGNRKYDEYDELLGKLRDSLITLLFPCIIGGFSLSKNIMYIMGGDEFAYGYRAFEILCIALMAAVFGCYYAQGILIPNRRESKYFICTSVSATVNIILNFWAIKFLGIEGAATTTLIAEVLIMVSCMYYSKGLHKEKVRVSINPIVVGCICICSLCKIVQQMPINLIMQTAISVLLSVIMYFIILYFGKNSLVMEITKVFRQKLQRFSK